jgi:hypothetical protein
VSFAAAPGTTILSSSARSAATASTSQTSVAISSAFGLPGQFRYSFFTVQVTEGAPKRDQKVSRRRRASFCDYGSFTACTHALNEGLALPLVPDGTQEKRYATRRGPIANRLLEVCNPLSSTDFHIPTNCRRVG